MQGDSLFPTSPGQRHSLSREEQALHTGAGQRPVDGNRISGADAAPSDTPNPEELEDTQTLMTAWHHLLSQRALLPRYYTDLRVSCVTSTRSDSGGQPVRLCGAGTLSIVRLDADGMLRRSHPQVEWLACVRRGNRRAQPPGELLSPVALTRCRSIESRRRMKARHPAQLGGNRARPMAAWRWLLLFICGTP